MEIKLFVLLFPFVFLFFLIAIIKLILNISGYFEIAKKYQSFTDYKKNLKYSRIMIGSIIFHNTIKAAIYPEGIYFSLIFLLRLSRGVKLLFIPWSDLELQKMETQSSFSKQLKIDLLIKILNIKLSLIGNQHLKNFLAFSPYYKNQLSKVDESLKV